jgi:hypothetical protein
MPEKGPAVALAAVEVPAGAGLRVDAPGSVDVANGSTSRASEQAVMWTAFAVAQTKARGIGHVTTPAPA